VEQFDEITTLTGNSDIDESFIEKDVTRKMITKMKPLDELTTKSKSTVIIKVTSHEACSAAGELVTMVDPYELDATSSNDTSVKIVVSPNTTIMISEGKAAKTPLNSPIQKKPIVRENLDARYECPAGESQSNTNTTTSPVFNRNKIFMPNHVKYNTETKRKNTAEPMENVSLNFQTGVTTVNNSIICGARDNIDSENTKPELENTTITLSNNEEYPTQVDRNRAAGAC